MSDHVADARDYLARRADELADRRTTLAGRAAQIRARRPIADDDVLVAERDAAGRSRVEADRAERTGKPGTTH